jgi:squalene-hopene/tetraprenyl-beta-curcumene cyclase
MQSKNGGFASFDSDNTYYYLNEIPFADHGALLDPPTSDVSARCATLLALTGRWGWELEACLNFLRQEQEPEGSWFGRWGTNYIYGTWSVLAALEKVRDPLNQFHVQRAANWLKEKQRPDGGWGEDCDTYFYPRKAGEGPMSTSFQTAWALLGLMAAGQADSEEVRRGVRFLIRTQQDDGLWDDDSFTAPGFPRVFYLKYHGYSKYFPFWALARYRTLRRQGMGGCAPVS